MPNRFERVMPIAVLASPFCHVVADKTLRGTRMETRARFEKWWQTMPREMAL